MRIEKSTTTIPAVTSGETVKKNSEIRIDFVNNSETTNNAIKQKEEEIINLVLEMLDLEDNFLKPTIIEKNGKLYLQLSRDRADKNRLDQKGDFKMSMIKYKLRLHDNVISKNNDIKYITESYSDKGFDDRAIVQGYSMIIPLEELGQNQRWFDFLTTNPDKIKTLVQEYLKLTNNSRQ